MLIAANASAQETTVRIGNAPSIASGALLIAIERGYFKEVGIKVEIDSLDTASNAIALLAQNQFQIVDGGLAAGYFNALEKDLPITIAMSRVSTPLGHNMMLRADLKDQIKEIRQLKGRVIATNGPGSVSTYEIGKLLETAGLTRRGRGRQGHPVRAVLHRASPTRRSTPPSPSTRSPRNCRIRSSRCRSRIPTL